MQIEGEGGGVSLVNVRQNAFAYKCFFLLRFDA